MKIIGKAIFILFIFELINAIIITYTNNIFFNVIGLLLYLIEIVLLIKLLNRTQGYHCEGGYEFKKGIMLLLSMCIFLCYMVAEWGLTAFFIPDYVTRISLNLMETVDLIIIAPIVEEIIFRGILINQFSKKYKLYKVNLIQAILFAILHNDIKALFFRIMFAIVLGSIYIYFNIYCCIMIHTLKNVVGFTIIVLNIKLWNFSKYSNLVLGVLFSLLVVGIIYEIKKKSIVHLSGFNGD